MLPQYTKNDPPSYQQYHEDAPLPNEDEPKDTQDLWHRDVPPYQQYHEEALVPKEDQPEDTQDIGHRDSTSCREASVELLHHRSTRLRRFLAFCLAIDYSIPEQDPEKLTKAELRYFVLLARHCFDGNDESPPLVDARRALNYLDPEYKEIAWCAHMMCWMKRPTIISEIVEPAEALGVPASVAMSMLRLFIASIAFFPRCGANGGIDKKMGSRGYRTQLFRLADGTSLRNLVAKFILDKTVLIDVVVLQPEFREMLKARMEKVHGKWFEKMNSPLDFVVAEGKGANNAASNIMEAETRNPKNYARPCTRLHITRDCWRAGRVEKSLREEKSWSTSFWRWFFKPSRLCIDERRQLYL